MFQSLTYILNVYLKNINVPPRINIIIISKAEIILKYDSREWLSILDSLSSMTDSSGFGIMQKFLLLSSPWGVFV
jgi:hypothetical protein